MTDFPFGIDPAGFVPEPEKPVCINVEGIREMQFANGLKPIAAMVAVIVSLRRLEVVVINDPSQDLTVTGWDPELRCLSVKLNN